MDYPEIQMRINVCYEGLAELEGKEETDINSKQRIIFLKEIDRLHRLRIEEEEDFRRIKE